VGNDKGIRRTLAAMSDEGVELSTRCYNAVIGAFCRRGDLQGAVDLFELMAEKGCDHDRGTYTAIIQAIAKTGNVKEAQRWIQLMAESGIAPDAFVYTLLAGALAKQGRPDDVEVVMQAMRAEGLQPTAATWTWLIVSTGVDLGGASSKKTPEAVFRDMVAAGVAPTAFTRSALDRQLPDGAAQRKRLFAELGVADPADDPYAARHAVKPLAVKSVQRRRSEVRAQLRSIDRRRTMKAKVAATRRIMMEVDRVEVTPKKGSSRKPNIAPSSGGFKSGQRLRIVPRTPAEQRDMKHGVGGFIRESDSGQPNPAAHQTLRDPEPWAGQRFGQRT